MGKEKGMRTSQVPQLLAGPARRPRTSYELSKSPQVPYVKILTLFDPLRCFQYHWQTSEPRVINQVPKRFRSHESKPDPGVTVYSTAAFTLAVIQMPRTKAAESNAMIEPIYCLIVLFRRI